MKNIEQKFKFNNCDLMKQMKNFEKECDYLINTYEARNVVLAKKLMVRDSFSTQQKLYLHKLATDAKLGAIKAFKRVLQNEQAALQALNQKPTFNSKQFSIQFTMSQQNVCTWASKILSDQAPKEIKKHYQPFTRILKIIGNIVLPFTMVVPLAKIAIQGRNHFFFNTKTNIENLAEDVLFRMKKQSVPKIKMIALK